MELEVGMYCYNKINRKLGIGKIISFQSNNNVNIKYKNDIELVTIGNVVASFNIIDLIEIGDYVNGRPVSSICMNGKNEIYEIEIKIPNNRRGVLIERIRNNEDIKSIVTEEQFESMEYKI